jgi:hypothetical protein
VDQYLLEVLLLYRLAYLWRKQASMQDYITCLCVTGTEVSYGLTPSSGGPRNLPKPGRAKRQPIFFVVSIRWSKKKLTKHMEQKNLGEKKTIWCLLVWENICSMWCLLVWANIVLTILLMHYRRHNTLQVHITFKCSQVPDITFKCSQVHNTKK